MHPSHYRSAPMIDLRPAADRLAALLWEIRDDQLPAGTPCAGFTVGDIVDHVGTMARAFTTKARGLSGPAGPPPAPSSTNLEPGWREQVASDLRSLAIAWADPAAWEGMTTAGGIDMPRSVAGLVVLDELVVHGWDIAASTGQAFDPPADEVAAAAEVAAALEAPRDGRLFGAVVPVPGDAPPLDQLLGLTGRDPSWQPT